MNIEFACTNCGSSLKVIAAFAGRVVQCPKCAKRTKVPAAEGSGSPGAAPTEAGPAAGAPAADAPVAMPAAPAPAPVAAEAPPAVSGEAAARLGKAALPAPGASPAKSAGVGSVFSARKAAPAKPAPEAAPVKSVEAPASAKPGGEPAKAKAEPVPPKGQAETAPAKPAEATAESRLAAIGAAGGLGAVVDRSADVARLEAQVRELQNLLDVARLRQEEAEKARVRVEKQRDEQKAGIEARAAQHFESELDAAKRSIAELERRIELEYKRRIAAESGANRRTPAEIEKELLESGAGGLTEEENAAPDALLAEIHETRFGQRMRLAILIHVVLIVATSIGYIHHRWIRKPVPAAPAEGLAAAAEQAGGAATNGGEKVVAPAAEEPGAAEPGQPPAQAAEPTAGAPAARGTGGGTSELERSIETLPAPGEVPKESTVSLDL